MLRELPIVALNTGGRRSELLGIKRSDVNWEQATVTLHASKTGKTRTVPLNPTALQTLRSVPIRIDGKLFPQAPSLVTSKLQIACERAGLTDVSFDTLRHTFATQGAPHGHPLPVVSELLGHADIR